MPQPGTFTVPQHLRARFAGDVTATDRHTGVMPRLSRLSLALGLLVLASCRTPPTALPQTKPPESPPVVATEPERPAPIAPQDKPSAPAPAAERTASTPPPIAEAAAQLEVASLRPGVWVHSSKSSDGNLAGNGLLILEGARLVLVDPAMSAEATEQLLQWAERELGQPIERAVLTQADPARVAGARVLKERGISVVALATTGTRIAELGGPRATSLGDLAPGGSVRLGTLELYYPGLEHRTHAAAVWLRSSRMLFTQCVASASEGTLLELNESERQAWAAAIRRVLQRFPDATVIVPYEGVPGGRDLLHQTLRLLAAAS